MDHIRSQLSSDLYNDAKQFDSFILGCNEGNLISPLIKEHFSFVSGVSSIFNEEDVESMLKIYSFREDDIKDSIVTYCDWRSAGNDLQIAINIYNDEPRVFNTVK